MGVGGKTLKRLLRKMNSCFNIQNVAGGRKDLKHAVCDMYGMQHAAVLKDVVRQTEAYKICHGTIYE